MAKDNNFTPPVTLPAQATAKKPYAKPEFQEIPLNVEAPLLSGSESKGGILKSHPVKDA